MRCSDSEIKLPKRKTLFSFRLKRNWALRSLAQVADEVLGGHTVKQLRQDVTHEIGYGSREDGLQGARDGPPVAVDVLIGAVLCKEDVAYSSQSTGFGEP